MKRCQTLKPMMYIEIVASFLKLSHKYCTERNYCKCFTIVTILEIKSMTIVGYPYGVPQYYTNVLDL